MLYTQASFCNGVVGHPMTDDAIERLIYRHQRRHILHSVPLSGGGWDSSAGSALLYA